MNSKISFDETTHAADTFSDVPILIHVGPHKSGTTWLQNSLLAHADGIIYDSSFRPSHRAFLTPRIEEFSAAEARNVFAPLLAKAREEKKAFVISDEALGGRPFGQRFLQEIAAERLAQAFPHAHILVTIREQHSILLSMYSEYLRYGYASSLKAFLEQDTGNPNIRPLLDLNFYEWDRFLKVYEAHFPQDRVMAIPMEWGLKHSNNYPSAIENFLGASLGVPANLDVETVERGSLSGWALEVLRQSNKLQPQDSRYLSRGGRFSPNSLGYQVNRLTPAFARKRSKKNMKKLVRDIIGNRFAESNQRLQEKIDFRLEDFAYQIQNDG